MNPVVFPEANHLFGPPSDLDESQCGSIPAFVGSINKGSLDGSRIVVVAWQPDAESLARLINGSPIFLTMIGGLLPHMVSTDFQTAISAP